VTTKKKKARSLDDVQLTPWKAVVFGDLHVSQKTLDRCLDTLARIRVLAQTHDAMVICTGDFWHQRGVLNVRQMDALLDELDQWKGIEFVIIPGNHDQVSQDGTIHGVRMFGAYPNITVATEPLLWHHSKVAFLPWREEPGEQAKLFAGLEGGVPWTVFAHAEVQGATTNGAHISPGRVSIAEVEAVSRACYCGHYHKRQKLGAHTWYLGSPFEQNFGERDTPHGVALIEEGRVEPHFIDFEDMPKHHRLVYGKSWKAAEEIASHDIVEVYAPVDIMGTERLSEVMGTIPAQDVRTLVLTEDEDELAVPSIAMGLEEAMHQWVQDCDGTDLDKFRLRQLGQSLLGEIPEARAVQPLAPEVAIERVTATDFCGVRGERTFEFPEGVTLIKGPMGAGKTSMMDALTWAFFDTTTPRKAGSHGASLRADEVVHDEAKMCTVRAEIRLAGRKQPVVVTRTKKRGSGSKVKITGIKAPDGIADQESLIQAALGISHPLWRTCVYLGQGSVGNFVTDADKRRKDLLSAAFGLDACPVAQTYTRARIKEVGASIERLRMQMVSDQRAVQVLQETDYKTQIAQWETQRKATLEAAQAEGESAKTLMAQCDGHMATEQQWLDSKAGHEAHVDTLTKSLVRSSPQNKAADLQQQFGALKAEKAIVERDDALARAELQRHYEAMEKGTSVCPTCERPFDASHQEQHAKTLDDKVRSFSATIQTFDVRMSDLSVKMGELDTGVDQQAEHIEAQIKESRDALEQCAKALNSLAVIKTNRVNAEKQLHAARAEYTRREREVNPFGAKQAECDAKIAGLTSKLAADRVEMDSYDEKNNDLQFWERGFGAKGLPVLVLRAALHELETYANTFMAQLTRGRIFTKLLMKGDELKIHFYAVDPVSGKVHERRYEQLSGGERRCVELAFNPFALGEMVFNRCGVRVNTLIVDELTTHLGQDEKPLVCDILRDLDRRSVVVIDHDLSVQSEFDQVWDLGAAIETVPEAEAGAA
jgi:DNA repair exonuclease SbcCD ATPase subunit